MSELSSGREPHMGEPGKVKVKNQRDRTAEAWARGMVQRFGYVVALDSAKRHRDQNAEATFSFSHWNRIVKALLRFATID